MQQLSPEEFARAHEGPFFQARIKLQWANQKIQWLQQSWEQFLDSDFCKVSVEDLPNGKQGIRATAGPIHVTIPLLIGDIVHNLRCSLDYSISEVLGWKNRRITFPMAEDREELVSSFRTEPETVGSRTVKKGRNAPIEVAVPGIGDFIVNQIRPYKGGHQFLWTLGKLDGRDKHMLLIPVLVPQTIPGINAVNDQGNRFINNTVTLEAGCSALPFVVGPSTGFKVESHGKPTADIFFNERGILEGKAVLPTVVNMSKAVFETLNCLSDFLIELGWTRPM